MENEVCCKIPDQLKTAMIGNWDIRNENDEQFSKTGYQQIMECEPHLSNSNSLKTLLAIFSPRLSMKCRLDKKQEKSP